MVLRMVVAKPHVSHSIHDTTRTPMNDLRLEGALATSDLPHCYTPATVIQYRIDENVPTDWIDI